MSKWIFGLVAIGFLGVAVPALALETGQCLPAAQVRTALTAEGMQPIIVGNRAGYGDGAALIFYANTNGSRGYMVRGDRPMGQLSNTICIESVFRDVRLNDITHPGIPAWARMTGIDPTTVERTCKAGKLGYQEQCNSHAVSLANLEASGVHVMLMATGSAINPRDKSIRQNQRIVVSVSPADNKGGVKAVTPDGASYMLSGFVDAAYTRTGEALLR
jgi:hypothetical protein